MDSRFIRYIIRLYLCSRNWKSKKETSEFKNKTLMNTFKIYL